MLQKSERQKLSKSRAVPQPGAGWPPGPQYTGLLFQVHLARARKLHLTKGFSAFTGLLHPFQALRPILRSLLHQRSYKVNLKVEDEVINVRYHVACAATWTAYMLRYSWLQTLWSANLIWGGRSTPRQNRSADRKKGLLTNTETNLPF